MSSTDVSRSAEPRLTDYEAEAASFRVTVPERYNPVVDIVEQWASEDPGALALISLRGDGSVLAEQTVEELAADARRAARALTAMGVKKGDPVLIMLPRVPAWYSAMLGAIRIGAVPMPAPNLLTPHDLEYRMTSAGAVAAITDAPGATKVDEIRPSITTLRHLLWWGGEGAAGSDWTDYDDALAQAGDGEVESDPTHRDDPMLIYFTSGTVSYPKMVLHTQAYGLAHVGTARFWHDLRPGDRHWTVSDTGWAKAAYGGLFGQWHERATVVQVALGKPDADEILRIISDNRITSFCAPPTLYRLLVLADLGAHDLGALRHCTSAGEPLNPEVIRAWADGTGGLTVYDGYGQTETAIVAANYRTVPVRPGSMGRPAPGWTVEILDADGQPAADDVVGEIAIRTEPEPPVGLFAGYHRDEEATARVFADGWYRTGDKASRDADGYLWFEGRNDDVITSSAYRIGPFEVESALIEHPAVAEAAVVGKDDPERTQVVCAFVILVPGHEGSDDLVRELQDHTKRTTAPYKYPREIHFVDTLPKTVSGKIRRTELRDWLREGRVG